MSERYSTFTPGGTGWLLQRITAAFLVVVLAFHFFQLHFVNHAADVTFAGTQARMENVGYFLTMVLFLIAGAFHGLNGVYNALVNQGLKGTPKKIVFWVLVIAGVALIVQGTYVALAMAGWS
ncbi:succinate dehydrogenase hydrophobic membrane anchor subunit [Natronobacterium gregoryi]|uniref:Succinate dehydrogenase n=2 Tax=Natronobacterium gregoryi TaxID=44930 RepID=L0AFA8_NATGS|nr:succinate dehydrogenase hydrophobic membrane anchor subunit [Natronobacterium gregoryi]AFZ71745.1 succinate dehydrogenase, hydrophobic anchor subunit [Natronobacterium gregoryi SP2]ELY72869.1 succinate dehydrogenase subunit D [Natronobacterium gregoryi SP2]PLK21073.1 succinate dehydrogenase [Natronobacterium gregoryi SP2]SFI88781.1 succinate dehydrogenase subunit D [Natronobacterium gregoryi]